MVANVTKYDKSEHQRLGRFPTLVVIRVAGRKGTEKSLQVTAVCCCSQRLLRVSVQEQPHWIPSFAESQEVCSGPVFVGENKLQQLALKG